MPFERNNECFCVKTVKLIRCNTTTTCGVRSKISVFRRCLDRSPAGLPEPVFRITTAPPVACRPTSRRSRPRASVTPIVLK